MAFIQSLVLKNFSLGSSLKVSCTKYLMLKRYGSSSSHFIIHIRIHKTHANTTHTKYVRFKAYMYKKLEIQPYLKYLSHDDAKLAFKARSNMIDVKSNFSSQNRQNLNCRLCLTEIDNQSHLLNCEYLVTDEDTEIPKYENLNGNNIEEIAEVIKVLKNRMRTRDTILNEILDI